MLFNSVHFLLFLPVVFALHWILPGRYRKSLLLIASYYFYMSWNPWFGLLLAGTTIIDWFVAIQIENSKFKIRNLRLKFDEKGEYKKSNAGTGWLLVSIFSNLGVLAAFKYFAFLYNTFEFTGSVFSGRAPQYIEAIVIPIGLSFYVFHSLSYVIDVYRGKIEAEKDLKIFALFVAFFPQLVAGPIARFADLGVQFHLRKFFQSAAFISGARLALWGFFKKIAIADRLADFVNPVFLHPGNFNGLTFLIIGFFFAVQVYTDFSGYTDIATGIARMFGYELALNWKRPLLAKSLHDFWKRHHISMTNWFRDYLYLSLGGNPAKNKFHSQENHIRWFRNLFLTFLLSGLWHGAQWTFVIWGGAHGIVYILEIIFKKRIVSRVPAIFGWIYFMLFHIITLLAFRAKTVGDLKIIYSKLFSFNWSFRTAFHELSSLNDLFPLLLSALLILFIFVKDISEEKNWLAKIPSASKWIRPAFYVLIFLALFAIGEFNTNEFIYYHF